MPLEIITSGALAPFRHGFFTRRGGVSEGIFAGLNCGPGSSDSAEAVATNRGLVAAAMEVPADHLVTVLHVPGSDNKGAAAPAEKPAKPEKSRSSERRSEPPRCRSIGEFR